MSQSGSNLLSFFSQFGWQAETVITGHSEAFSMFLNPIIN